MVLIFGVWVALSFVTAYNRTAAYPFFIEYLKIFVMFTVSTYIIRSVKQLWILFLIAGVTLGYIAYEVNYLYVASGGNFIYIYDLGYGGLDNNGAGLMLAMGVPLCYFAWEGIKRWWRWAFLALVPFLLHAVLMSYSRGAMVSLIAAIPFYLLRSRRRAQLALVLLGASMLVPAMAGEQIRKRFFSIEEHEVDESAAGRKRSWEAAWKMALDHPFFGVGLRNADLFSERYGAGYMRTIHSQYLQTAADSGLVGLGLYLTALGSVWLNARRARRAAARRDDPESRCVHAIASGVETSMVVFCVGGVFLSLENFELPYLLLLIGAQLPVVYRGQVEPQKNWATGVVGEVMRSRRAEVHPVS
jgi:probable O-glycosylation ligase (exosortase A-associated)